VKLVVMLHARRRKLELSQNCEWMKILSDIIMLSPSMIKKEKN
jgi:hypothetical protein